MGVAIFRGIELSKKLYRAYPTGRIDLARKSKLTAMLCDCARRELGRDMIFVQQIVNEPETKIIQVHCTAKEGNPNSPDQVTFLVRAVS